ncbi:MAG: type II toxin-antitoxin system VapC family toxin [Candidatus Acididesulfobacter diazotrophicus]|jgi:predicted nucleic acid-binding protein|uniref:Type II toxin-antitoxin system VapC family toxin n=1 Tax=Candidatus Acididesulfobacter diazotrophicus TaxID=2597226 RepID=A0A519BNY2_9DELT|nr:MAG: type II toxin-antitoxin system VapC family toxin [Candidatus Acididesulfobacter diazotrophicus]
MENSKIILDSCAYSAFLRGHGKVKSVMQISDEIFINSIIIGELLSGFALGNREERNRDILLKFLKSPRVKTVAVNNETSERYAVIINYLRKNGTPIPTNDIWIAASAMEYGLKVVTAGKHYLNVPHIITEFYD